MFFDLGGPGARPGMLTLGENRARRSACRFPCFSFSRWPGPNGVTSTVRRVFRGGEYSAYYPNDFARRPAQGDYSWTCDVEDGVHAMGSFVIRDDGAVTLPARN